ncbi:MAG: shikimate dehydrogenase [Anaerolineales bacterium]
MDTFAFIIHPIDPKRDVSRKYPLLGKYLSVAQINFFSTFVPPVYISEITGFRSEASGKEIKGWFVACPYTPQRMMELPERTVYGKITQTGKMAEKLGAMVLGLGAFTSVVGDGGLTVASQLSIPVTTGDSYTVAVAVDSVRVAARLLGLPLASVVGARSACTAAIVGATGAIGAVASELIARDVARLWLIGKPGRTASLEALRDRIFARSLCDVRIAHDVSVLPECDVVLTVTSAGAALIHPEHLKPGAIVCDVARPRDVSPQVAAMREDVLVIDGGMVEVPGDVDFHFDFGFPPGMAYACMAETMALALEGRWESYTLGKDISVSQVEEIARIAAKHGFRLGGFRSFERPVTAEQIARVKGAVRMRAHAQQQRERVA